MTIEVAFLQELEPSAELTRRDIYSLIARASTVGSVAGGIIGGGDLQITTGSGLHVVVSAGEMVVPGSSSSTQSGYYFRSTTSETLSIAAANPSLPRIDRVSAIVKDKAYTGTENKGELAVQTGTATAGATLANLNGVAAAPTSSSTLGYVLVPANASSLEAADISNISELLTLGISPLRVINTSEPVSGQISEIGTGTVTLPVPKISSVVGAFNNSGSNEVTVSSVTHGGGIYGDFTAAATSIKLLPYQHVLLAADGSSWLIIAGEPKRTATWEEKGALNWGTEYTPSTTRPVLVAINFNVHNGGTGELQVGGVKVQEYNSAVGGYSYESSTFEVNPGQKWKLISLSGEHSANIFTAYLVK